MAHLGTVLTITDIDGTKHRVCRSGLLYVYGDKSSVPLTLLQDAARIPDFGRNLKRPAAIRERLKALGYLGLETRFDAAHGRRYMLGAYGYACQPFTTQRAAQRRVVLAAMDGIENLRQHHIDCGCDAAELDRLAKKDV